MASITMYMYSYFNGHYYNVCVQNISRPQLY